MNITTVRGDSTILLDLLFALMLAGLLILAVIKRSKLKKEEKRLMDKYDSLIQAENIGGRDYE